MLMSVYGSCLSGWWSAMSPLPEWYTDFLATISSFRGPDCMLQSILAILLLCSCASRVLRKCQPTAEFVECVKKLLFPLFVPVVSSANTPAGLHIYGLSELRVLWVRMSWASACLKLCSRFLCAAEIVFTWVGDCTASAVSLSKLNEERGNSKNSCTYPEFNEKEKDRRR